jgi:outer membrane protein TolC
MKRISRFLVVASLGLGVPGVHRPALGEDLFDAWNIALRVNAGLQSQQATTVAQGLNLRAARSDRWPTVRTLTANAFLTVAPEISTSGFLGSSTVGRGGAGGAGGGTGTGTSPGTSFPSALTVLGPGQRDIPASLTYANVPLYTGGRLLRNIDAADAQLGAQRSEEVRTAMDLKLTVAEAYIGVLRAQKNLEVARTNVEQLGSFARDVRNRREQGLAIRSDELAAEVSLANAQLAEIQARTALESARATYNRYLLRPLSQSVALEELTAIPPTADWKQLAEEASRDIPIASAASDEEIRDLTMRAMGSRPELAGLSEQARAYGAQAAATRAGIRPQVSFSMGFLYLGSNNLTTQGIGAANFVADWTITDSGATRRRAAAQHQQERAALLRREDTAADIALQVRTRWLDLHQARRRVPVARLAVVQAEENINVVTDRYRQQLSTYTEVLDAETRRVQSLNNFYNATYDESLAVFRLRRAVGDL